MVDAQPSRQAIVGEIRRYLARHPNASDSIKGVRWWLRVHLRSEPEPRIQAALDELVARREITPECLGDGTVIYGHPSKAGAGSRSHERRTPIAGDAGRESREREEEECGDVKKGETHPRRK